VKFTFRKEEKTISLAADRFEGTLERAAGHFAMGSRDNFRLHALPFLFRGWSEGGPGSDRPIRGWRQRSRRRLPIFTIEQRVYSFQGKEKTVEDPFSGRIFEQEIRHMD